MMIIMMMIIIIITKFAGMISDKILHASLL